MITNLPNLLHLNCEEQYRNHYKEKYCKKELETFDGIKVKFYEDKFEHAFYESSNHKARNKDIFSIDRATRIDWIEHTLKDNTAELHLGWDRDTKNFNNKRRVALISKEDYVVIIEFKSKNYAKFITAYYADNSSSKIRNTPFWQ